MKSIQDIVNEGSSNMKLWDAVDKIKDELGADKFVDELCRAMSDDDLAEKLKFIARNYEIKVNI